MSPVSDRRGLALIVLAAALWGTTGTAQALGPATSDPIAVGVTRLVVAAPALAISARFGRGNVEAQSGTWRPIVIAGVAMAAYQPLFFTAVARTGVALGTVVTIGSAPLLAGLLAWAIDKEAPSSRWWPATGLGIAGVVMIALSEQDMGAEGTGVLLALGAGLSFAIYILAARHVVELVDPFIGTAQVFAVAAFLSVPLLLWADLGWMKTAAGWLMAAHLGLFATALAYVLFSLGMRTTRASTAATASLTEPVTATILGVALLGEVPGVAGWLGIGLILAGLYIMVSRRQDPVRSGELSV